MDGTKEKEKEGEETKAYRTGHRDYYRNISLDSVREMTVEGLEGSMYPKYHSITSNHPYSPLI